MTPDIIAAFCTFAAGAGIAAVNYLISKAVLRSSPQKFSFVTVLRQVIQIGYLVAVFFVTQKLGLNMVYTLIGAVVGMTLPMFVFTKKLISFNDQLKSDKKEKGDDSDG